MFSSIPHLWPGLYVICMWTSHVASHLNYTVLCSLCQDLWIYEPETPLLQYIVCCHWATTAAWCAIPLSHYSSMVCYTTEPLQPHGVLPLSHYTSKVCYNWAITAAWWATPLSHYTSMICYHKATTAAWCAKPMSHYSSMVCYHWATTPAWFAITEPLQ